MNSWFKMDEDAIYAMSPMRPSQSHKNCCFYSASRNTFAFKIALAKILNDVRPVIGAMLENERYLKEIFMALRRRYYITCRLYAIYFVDTRRVSPVRAAAFYLFSQDTLIAFI